MASEELPSRMQIIDLLHKEGADRRPDAASQCFFGVGQAETAKGVLAWAFVAL